MRQYDSVTTVRRGGGYDITRALVLVHGGGHGADCWDLTVGAVRRIAPDLTVLAFDLPGRRGKPGDLRTLTIAQCVDSVVADIEEAGLEDVVIVGHSIAGATVPGVVARLGSSRVRELILAAAMVPPNGASIKDVLSGPLKLARSNAKFGRQNDTPIVWARLVYLNEITRAQWQFVKGRVYPESGSVLADAVSREEMPTEIPRTWILTTRDRALSANAQHRGIEAIGGVQTLIEVDTCHDLMVSEPEWLAAIFVERCQLYG